MRNWQNFARLLLTHRNPYTGLTWAEDPALIGICPINEDVLTWSQIEKIPSVNALYEKAFEAWWASEENRALSGGRRGVGRHRFLSEVRIEADLQMHAYLRSLGVDALLTGSNFLNMQSLAYARELYDVVDNHQYWAHPSPVPNPAGGRGWQGFSQESAVAALARTPRGIMASRLWGKPYTVTEFNYIAPNQYRAEGWVLMPAYASLQDWDALYSFDYASRESHAIHGGAGRTFSLTSDPIGFMADRLAALLFRRGDISPAERKIGFAIDEDTAFSPRNVGIPEVFSRIGLISRIGSGTENALRQLEEFKLDAVVINDDQPIPEGGSRIYRANQDLLQRLLEDGVLPSGSVDDSGRNFRSDTGEIVLKADEGTLTVVTQRSELFVLRSGSALQGKVVSVNNGEGFATVSVVSVDDRPLAESRRLLVLHLTDSVPSGTRFAQPDRSVLEAWGKEPHLVRSGDAEITMHLDPLANYEAWVVDSAGRRLRKARFRKEADAWHLSVGTVTAEGTQLAYEILRSSNPLNNL